MIEMKEQQNCYSPDCNCITCNCGDNCGCAKQA